MCQVMHNYGLLNCDMCPFPMWNNCNTLVNTFMNMSLKFLRYWQEICPLKVTLLGHNGGAGVVI